MIAHQEPDTRDYTAELAEMAWDEVWEQLTDSLELARHITGVTGEQVREHIRAALAAMEGS